MATKSTKRRAWTPENVRTLKTLAAALVVVYVVNPSYCEIVPRHDGLPNRPAETPAKGEIRPHRLPGNLRKGYDNIVTAGSRQVNERKSSKLLLFWSRAFWLGVLP